MNIREYKTAFANSPEQLDQNVNALIEAGFEPFGSPYSLRAGGGACPVCQTMVRRGATKEENKQMTDAVISAMRKKAAR